MPYTLKQLRALRDLTQKEVADELGVSELTLANYEKGIRQPTAPTIKKIMEFYDVKFDDIIFLCK